VQQLRHTPSSESGRLLRVLFVRFDQVPANSGEAHLLWLTVLLSLAFGGDHDPAAAFCEQVWPEWIGSRRCTTRA